MDQLASKAEAKETAVPSLMADRAFWGLNLTQFLGAFNDNLFKQLVMLICVDRAAGGGRDLQGLAMVLFAWPFIAFSGFAGYLSDRYSKRRIIVICKAAEFLIVLLGMIGFVTGNLAVLLGVLCLMGVHSAYFGPSKYGILPELLRDQDLPRANGSVLMATFLAIIFGLSAAGAAKHTFDKSLWLASLPCLVIALMGLGTSLLIRPTPVAHPGLKFHWSAVGIAPETRATLKANRTLLGVLLLSSVFWFVGGTVYPPAINAFGKDQLKLNDLQTGVMAASTGLGIAIGCVAAGFLSRNRVRGWLVRTGAWGLTFSLAALCLPGPGWDPVRDEIAGDKVPHQYTRVPANAVDQSASRIGQCLASHVSTDFNDVTLSTAVEKLSERFGLKTVIDWKAINVDPESPVTQKLNRITFKSSLEQLFSGHTIQFGSDQGALLIGPSSNPPKNSSETIAAFRSCDFYRGSLLGPFGSVAALILVGVFAGFFTVPLQVYLQTAAPADQKGRIIGAMNLFNWFGIAGSGGVYSLGRLILINWLELPHAALFGFAGAMMLPVAIFYRPPESQVVEGTKGT